MFAHPLFCSLNSPLKHFWFFSFCWFSSIVWCAWCALFVREDAEEKGRKKVWHIGVSSNSSSAGAGRKKKDNFLRKTAYIVGQALHCASFCVWQPNKIFYQLDPSEIVLPSQHQWSATDGPSLNRQKGQWIPVNRLTNNNGDDFFEIYGHLRETKTRASLSNLLAKVMSWRTTEKERVESAM